MPDDSNSKDKKNTKEEDEPQSIKKEDQESSKPAPKKKKLTKDPNRHIADLAKKYSKLSQQFSPYEDLIRKASPAYELERQLMEKHDVMRIIEESDWMRREFERFGGQDLNGMLGFDQLTERTISEIDRSRAIFESLSRYHIDQIGTYHDLLYAYSYVNEIVEDITKKLYWVDSIKIDPVEEVIGKLKDIIQIDLRDIFKISSDLKDFYSSLPDEDVIIQDSGSIIYAGESYEISEINDLLLGSIKSSGLSKTGKLTHKIFLSIFNVLKRIKNLKKSDIVKGVLIILISDFIKHPIYDEIKNLTDIYIEPEQISSAEVLPKNLNKSEFINTFFKDFRIVDVDRFLNVRKDSSQEADLIGKLCKGDLVRVLA